MTLAEYDFLVIDYPELHFPRRERLTYQELHYVKKAAVADALANRAEQILVGGQGLGSRWEFRALDENFK